MKMFSYLAAAINHNLMMLFQILTNVNTHFLHFLLNSHLCEG